MTTVANPARAGGVAEIADRRRADVERELGSRKYSGLADDAADHSAAAGAAPRPIVERLAAPGLHLIAEVKRRSPSAGAIAVDSESTATVDFAVALARPQGHQSRRMRTMNRSPVPSP